MFRMWQTVLMETLTRFLTKVKDCDFVTCGESIRNARILGFSGQSCPVIPGIVLSSLRRPRL